MDHDHLIILVLRQLCPYDLVSCPDVYVYYGMVRADCHLEIEVERFSARDRS